MNQNLLLVVTYLIMMQVAIASDRDGNRLSDLFEFIYFTGPTEAASDPDGDGLSNLEEMQWGSNPLNGASGIGAATARVEGDEFVLAWRGVAGKWYRLQVSANLKDWTNITEGRIQEHKEALSDGLRFWRLQVVLDTPDSDGNGFDDWEEALWRTTYGKPLQQSDLDGDGLADSEEFAGARNPGKKDHPAVGLVVFTPLEK